MMNIKIVPKCEGEQSKQDQSYKILGMKSEFVEMEKGIEILKFSTEARLRDLKVQFGVLDYMTQTAKHTNNKLFKDPVQFVFNRNKTILPFEYSMVSLGEDKSDPQNYINANYVTTVVEGFRFIATQGPLKNTIKNFWKMIDQQNVKIIMMFCNLQENKQQKCYQYWPCKQGILQLGPDFTVQKLQQNKVKQNLFLRKFKLTRNKTTKQIIQYQWKSWLDNSAPHIEDYQYLEYLLDVALYSAERKQKIVTHCSGGIGRTGTFISLFNIKTTLNFFKQNQDTIPIDDMKISVFGTIRRLREQRWKMVYNLTQYKFVYDFTIIEIAKMFSKDIIN